MCAVSPLLFLCRLARPSISLYHPSTFSYLAYPIFPPSLFSVWYSELSYIFCNICLFALFPIYARPMSRALYYIRLFPLYPIRPYAYDLCPKQRGNVTPGFPTLSLSYLDLSFMSLNPSLAPHAYSLLFYLPIYAISIYALPIVLFCLFYLDI